MIQTHFDLPDAGGDRHAAVFAYLQEVTARMRERGYDFVLTIRGIRQSGVSAEVTFRPAGEPQPDSTSAEEEAKPAREAIQWQESGTTRSGGWSIGYAPWIRELDYGEDVRIRSRVPGIDELYTYDGHVDFEIEDGVDWAKICPQLEAELARAHDCA